MDRQIETIVRRCAPRDMYDDNGYCETKIKRMGVFYERLVGNNGDCHCSECMLQMILQTGERDFAYKDMWFEDFEFVKTQIEAC